MLEVGVARGRKFIFRILADKDGTKKFGEEVERREEGAYKEPEGSESTAIPL